MNCTVYRVANGKLVLVPDCMRAALAVEAELGALVRCGSVETDMLDRLLAGKLESALDDNLYAVCPPDLALRFGYRPDSMVELPEDFHWEGGDWWTEGDAIALMCCGQSTEQVASVVPYANGGWKASTNDHKEFWFRGEMVTTSRAAAMQFVALWARSHLAQLRREATSPRRNHVLPVEAHTYR